MNSFLNYAFLSNTIRDYLWVIGVILFALILKRVISKYIAIFLCKIFRRIWKAFDQQTFIELIVNPLGVFFIISVSIVALLTLTFPHQINFHIYKYSFAGIVFAIAISIQIVVFTWLQLRIIDFISSTLVRRSLRTNDKNDNQIIVF